jgi:hypothetical protein
MAMRNIDKRNLYFNLLDLNDSTFKMYFDSPGKVDRKSRSSSKKKGNEKPNGSSNVVIKSTSVSKEIGNNFGNNMVGGKDKENINSLIQQNNPPLNSEKSNIKLLF